MILGRTADVPTWYLTIASDATDIDGSAQATVPSNFIYTNFVIVSTAARVTQP